MGLWVVHFNEAVDLMAHLLIGCSAFHRSPGPGRSGGSKSNPNTSAAFGANWGSVRIHQLRRRSKEMPCLRNTRHMWSLVTFFNRCASNLPFQRANTAGGGSSKACRIRFSTVLSYWTETAPSANPFRPLALKRPRHLLPVEFPVAFFRRHLLIAHSLRQVQYDLARNAILRSVLAAPAHDRRVRFSVSSTPIFAVLMAAKNTKCTNLSNLLQ